MAPSEPRRRIRLAATAAVAAPGEPPSVCVASQGLLMTPCTSLAGYAKSPSMNATLVFPVTIAPARRSRATAVASVPTATFRNAGFHRRRAARRR